MNRVIELSERDIIMKKAKLSEIKQQIEEDKLSIKNLEKRLEIRLDHKLAEQNLKNLKEQLKSGKTAEGKELEDIEKESLKVEIATQEEFIKMDMPMKRVRAQIKQLQHRIWHNENYMVRPLEKQIREGVIRTNE